MILNIFGVRVEVSVPFTVILAFLLINDQTGLMSASLFAVLFHELGHLFAMLFYRLQPQSIKLSSAGILICGSAFCTAKENIIISLFGPFVNLLLTFVFWVLANVLGSTLFLYFAAVQFLVGFINILPIKGLDGGSVLYCILSRFKNVNADLVCNVTSLILSCVMLTVGVAVAVKNVANPSLFLLSIYLLVLNLIKR